MPNHMMRGFLVAFAVGFYIGCSPVKFTKDPEYQKCQSSGEVCVSADGRDYFDSTLTIRGGVVDILIVNDNSASMSEEQKQMANKFGTFLAKLDSERVDYRIGMTTTDVSDSNNEPRAINQNGDLQDGKLIKFDDGSYFITPNSANKESLFASAVKRTETLSCETWLVTSEAQSLKTTDKTKFNKLYYEKCPSGDERGIYASNLVIKNNPHTFLRGEANLAIILISDEDNRSVGYVSSKTPDSNLWAAFALQSLDLPANFVENFNSLYGTSKNLAFNSIVVKSGDTACRDSQAAQLPGATGTYGASYVQLSNLTGGVVGSVCASDYTSQLGDIATNIIEKINSVSIACENPNDLIVQLTNVNSGLTYDLSGRLITFSQDLPPGSQVRLKYSCETL